MLRAKCRCSIFTREVLGGGQFHVENSYLDLVRLNLKNSILVKRYILMHCVRFLPGEETINHLFSQFFFSKGRPRLKVHCQSFWILFYITIIRFVVVSVVRFVRVILNEKVRR